LAPIIGVRESADTRVQLGGAQKVQKLRFLVSLITENNDFQAEQAASAQAAAQQLGVDLEILYADGDAITQSTQILKSIQAHPSLQPNAIVVEPAGGTGFPQAAKAAVAAGIGWCLLNREADYVADLRTDAKIPAFVVTNDHEDIGRVQARQLRALLPDVSAVMYVIGPTESSTARSRRSGFEAISPRNMHITLLRGKWTEESGRRGVEGWLKLGVASKSAIEAIVAQNDAMALGARKAFEGLADSEEKKKWLSLPFLGCDGLEKTGQAWVRKGLLAATVVTPPMAGQAVQIMAQALRSGTRAPERTVTSLESFPSIEKLAKLQPAAVR
jgi:ribose transport system substrate-binding protein